MKHLVYLTKVQLQKLSTQRLLAYKNRLMKVHEAPDCGNLDESRQYRDGVWQSTYAAVKCILASREHVEK